MIVNLEEKKRIKKLKSRLNYLEDCLSYFSNIEESKLNINNVKIINKIIQELPNSKREFSLQLRNKSKESNIYITYQECKIIYEYLQIGHKKIYLKGYIAYHKLINNH
tara:strand:+ start:15921 stop:16244 length:324 start_codon:yes stop_codon:yes gene_type:complete